MNSSSEPKLRVFPTKHPFVENKDGSKSNVVLASFGIGTKENPKFIVVPTMVDGKLYKPQEAIEIAKKYGFNRYPSFKSQEDADSWARANHGNIDENGFLTK